MLIRFTRGTALGGVGNDANPGQVLDLPDGAARDLIAKGRAVKAEPTEPEPKRQPNKRTKPWTSSAKAP